MSYYILEPEVAGGFGKNTILDPSFRPPNITKFHYQFEDWLGDPILETVASFIVTDMLKDKFEKVQVNGVQFGMVEISKSEQFEDLFPDQELPKFVWLQVTGKPGKDDFGLSPEHKLVVSQRVLDILREGGMSHCMIREYI